MSRARRKKQGLGPRLVTALLLVATVAVIALGAASFSAKVNSFQPLGFEATAIGETWQVATVTDHSTGLERGDRILTINGELVGAGNRMSRSSLEEQLTARSHSELLVERKAGLEQIEYRRPPLEIDFAYLLLALTGVLYLLIGLYTLARGADRQVVLFNLWALASAALSSCSQRLPPSTHSTSRST